MWTCGSFIQKNSSGPVTSKTIQVIPKKNGFIVKAPEKLDSRLKVEEPFVMSVLVLSTKHKRLDLWVIDGTKLVVPTMTGKAFQFM